MLNRLFIRNYAIIDELNLSLENGLSTITGETGAGKSILLGALKLVLGERADLQSIGDLNSKCIIEAEFQIQDLDLEDFFNEHDLEYQPESIFRREILPSGKSRAFINDSPVTLSIINSLSDRLIDIHSQFNTHRLLQANFQLDLLDAVADNLEIRKKYTTKFKEYSQLKKELAQHEENLQEGKEKADYTNFLLEELRMADLQPNELTDLEEELNTLQNAEAIGENLNVALQIINAEEVGLNEQLRELIQKLDKNANFVHSFKDLLSQAESIRIEMEELESQLQYKQNELEHNPEQKEKIENRLGVLYDLMQKHRVNSIQELIEICDNLSAQNADFKSLSDLIDKIKSQVSILENDLTALAHRLSKNRQAAVPKFKEEVEKTLKRLGMENAQITANFEESQEFLSNGKEWVKLLFTANKGQTLKPIQSAVSGGEMSRLMLTIKKILTSKFQLPTLILDEIDTGVSGKIAHEMGAVMQEMAENMQVLAITHLPQVAAKGHSQFKVFKSTESGKTQTQIKQLNPDERITEIATLISGYSITENAKNQAVELLKS